MANDLISKIDHIDADDDVKAVVNTDAAPFAREPTYHLAKIPLTTKATVNLRYVQAMR